LKIMKIGQDTMKTPPKLLSESSSGDKDNKATGIELLLDEEVLEILVGLAQVIYRYDYQAGKLAYITANCKNIMGHEQAQLVGKEWQDIARNIHPSDLTFVSRRRNEVLEHTRHDSATVGNIEYRWKKDGKYIWLRSRFHFTLNSEGKTQFETGLLIDVTHSRNLYDSMDTEQQWNLSLIDAIPDMIFRFNRAGVIVGYKPAAGLQPVVPPEVFMGRPYNEVLPPDISDLFDKTCEKVRHDGTVETIEYELKIEGEIHTYEARAIHSGVGDVLLVVRDITENKRSKAALLRVQNDLENRVDRRTHELRELHKKLLNASETERRRLARELHDSVAQDLIVLQLLLKQYSPDAKNFEQQQTTVQNITNKLITDIRRICQGLYPPVLESLGLYQALKSLEEYHQMTGMNVEIRWEAASRPTRLKQDLEIGLFRIAQEALSNAFKHGKAQKAIVELYSSADGAKLTMTITDNGCGEVDPEKVKSGFGLQTMQDRANAMGGTFAFLPVPHGTCVCVEVPLATSEEDDSFM